MLRLLAASLALVALVACGARGDLGDMTPIAVNADSGVDGGALFASPEAGFTSPKPDAGTVSPQAVVAAATYRSSVVPVAVDSLKADAKAPDCIRLDFSGKGDFRNAAVVPLKVLEDKPAATQPAGTQPAEAFFRASFGPQKVEFARDGRTIPAMVYGEFTRRGNEKWLGLKVGTALEGPCLFGDKIHVVRVLDGNGNFRPGDKPMATQKEGLLIIKPEDEDNLVRVTNGSVTGDTLLVSYNVLADPTTAPTGFRGRYAEQLYGQPVQVDGKWYEVKLSPDGKRATIAPVELKTGILKTPHPAWSTRLVGPQGVIVAVASGGQAEVPSGEYGVMGFQEYLRGGAGGGRGGLLRTHNDDLMAGKGKVVIIKPGETTELSIGSPMQCEVKAEQEGRNVKLSLVLADVIGGPVGIFRSGGAEGFSTAPEVTILDAAGKAVYTAKLASTALLSYSATWAVPEGLSGTFSAELKFGPEACEVQGKKTTFAVK